ncbi:MAG: ABC transporter ATP-binding protein/permease [Bacilli bacterium]|nr:ABC transporter ATP-binding protein/permease [Bacilli bacterium]
MHGYWGQVFAAWALCAIEVACEVLIPFFSEFLINTIDPGVAYVGQPIDKGALWMYAGIMFGLAIVSTLSGIFAGFFAAGASAGFGKQLRKAMYYKIQDFSFNNIDHFSSAALVTRMTTDVTNVQFSIQMILRMVVRAPMMMIFALAMAAVKSWQLSMVFLIIIPFLGFFLFFISIKVHPTFVKVFNAYDGLNASVQENLNGIRVVKSFGREDFENEKFGKVSYYIYRMFVKAERMLAFNNPIMLISVYAAMLVISWFGAHMVVESGNAPDGFNTGTLTSLFSYVMQILMSLQFISMGFVMITISRNSAERIDEVIETIPDLASPKNPITEVKDGSVDFEHVCFRYSKEAQKDVIHDVSLHIPSGSTVGIIGVTGSSKSSLVSLIARLYDVTSGEVKVGGKNVKDYDLEVLRDSVAVVLQKNVLFTGTIKSNLLWGNPDATDEDIKKAARLACADEFIERQPLQYDAPIDQGGTNVSGGQRQRLCIARALLKRPKILILDDSTSAVDTHTDALIRSAFKNEIPETTKFIIAQRVLSIKECDKILILEDGQIIAEGTNDELMKTSPVYQELYETQLGGGDFDAA